MSFILLPKVVFLLTYTFFSFLIFFNFPQIYVIGGIVDRSVQKSRTLDCAYLQNIKAMRLPLKEYFPGNISHILNIDTIVSTICTYERTKNWEKTFEITIPIRKKVSGGKIGRKEENKIKLLNNEKNETIDDTI